MQLKPFLKLFIFLALATSITIGNAASVVTANISYKNIGFRKWEITLMVYTDCSQGTLCNGAPNSQTSCTTQIMASPETPGNCNGVNAIPINMQSVRIWDPMVGEAFCLAQTKNICTNNGTVEPGNYIPGFEVTKYQGILDLSDSTYNQTCSEWRLEWSGCCRSKLAQALVVPNNTPFYTYAVFNIHHNQYTGLNNGPELRAHLVELICGDVHYGSTLSFVDPDRDSLTFQLIPSPLNKNANLVYLAPYKPNYPFQLNALSTNNPILNAMSKQHILLDSITGQMWFNVMQNSYPFKTGSLGVEVSKWSYDANNQIVLAGKSLHELFIYAKDCLKNNSPKLLTQLPNQAIKDEFEFDLKPGEEIRFDVIATDDDTLESGEKQETVITFVKDSTLPSAISFKPGYQPEQKPREDRWQFYWKPIGKDTLQGLYKFKVIGYDLRCHEVTQTNKTIQVRVIPSTGVDEEFNNRLLQSIVIYPNPSGGEFNLQFNTAIQLQKVEIYNPVGLLVGTSMVNKISLDAKGLFYLKIYTNKGVVVKKVVCK